MDANEFWEEYSFALRFYPFEHAVSFVAGVLFSALACGLMVLFSL